MKGARAWVERRGDGQENITFALLDCHLLRAIHLSPPAVPGLYPQSFYLPAKLFTLIVILPQWCIKAKGANISESPL